MNNTTYFCSYYNKFHSLYSDKFLFRYDDNLICFNYTLQDLRRFNWKILGINRTNYDLYWTSVISLDGSRKTVYNPERQPLVHKFLKYGRS